MGNEIDHGSRLSERDYERQIVDLHSRTPEQADDANDAAADDALRRRTLDLTIDFRLGRDFPAARRDALWKIHTAVEKRRVRMMFSWLLHAIPFSRLHGKANGLARYLVAEYATVLSEEELALFFDLKKNERPALPVDSASG